MARGTRLIQHPDYQHQLVVRQDGNPLMTTNKYKRRHSDPRHRDPREAIPPSGYMALRDPMTDPMTILNDR